MTRAVWKYPVPPYVEETIRPTMLPAGARVIHADVQRDGVYVWAEVTDPDPAALSARWLGVFATGQEIPDGWQHVATATTPGAEFVWHVYGVPAP